MMNALELPSAVGLSALVTASERADESARPDALFHDPLAQAMLSLVEDDAGLVRTENGRQPQLQLSSDLKWLYGNYLAIRTHYVDQMLLEATRDGLTQVVLLASGLDGRAYRLPWSPDTTLYELDQPAILDFKQEVAQRSSLESETRLVPVPADLREDWLTPLQAAGFDANQPNLWVLEGILRYLDPADAERLLAELTSCSTAGSRLVAVYSVGDTLEPARRVGHDKAADFAAQIRNLRPGPSVSPDVWLPRHGWQAETTDLVSWARTTDRSPTPAMDPTQGGAVCHFVTARKP